MYNQNETEIRKPMTFSELCVIWDKIQKHNAKMQISKKDRAKTSLTYKEQLNKYAQMGGVITYGDKLAFTYDKNMGMGLLITKTRSILGATISDFFKAIGE
jgi:hypothetical protein